VLLPLTLIGGSAMAWMFGKQRNIIPLAIGQAILGSIIFWAFPLAWHHHLRVGPGYYSSWLPVPTGWRAAAATSSKAQRGQNGSTMLPVLTVKKEISDKCRPKERGDAAFTIKRWKRSI
jgi:hypothetical protein